VSDVVKIGVRLEEFYLFGIGDKRDFRQDRRHLCPNQHIKRGLFDPEIFY